jgi:hypothetical protein
VYKLATTFLLICAMAISAGCQSVRRATLNLLGVDTGFSLQRYDNKDVAVLPVITNPAFPLSPDDRDAIRDAVVRNLRIVAKFHPQSRDLSPEARFPYTQDFQRQSGLAIGAPATIGISVASYVVTSAGSIRQLTVTLSFVDSLEPQRHVDAVQTYKSESPTEALDLRGLGFDWAVFFDLSRLDSSLRNVRDIKAVNASADQKGPSLLALVTPTVVLASGAVAEATSPPGGLSTYRTTDEFIPVRVLANDDAGLSAVAVVNLSTRKPSSLFAAGPDTKRVRYVDSSVAVKLAMGSNSFQVSAQNRDKVTSTRNFTVERLASSGISAAFLAIAADSALSLQPITELLDPMKLLTGGDPASLALLSGSNANYIDTLSFANDIDQRMAAVHGISLIYFAGKISATEKGLRLVPVDSRYADVVSGMPLEGFVVSLAPRIAFFDLCAIDPDQVVAPLTIALGGRLTAAAYAAPAVFSIHSCGQAFQVPVATALKVEGSKWATMSCVPLKSLVDDMRGTAGVYIAGSLDDRAADLCIARH